jgi:hypothetical protein
VKVDGTTAKLALVVVPVPDNEAVCGEPAALSFTLTEAVRLPVVVGVNVTVIWQEPPASTEPPQLLDWE